jgi:hypothetical protein
MLSLFPKIALPGVARVSIGIENSEGDIDALIQALSEFARQPKAREDKGLRAQMEAFVRAAAQRVYG